MKRQITMAILKMCGEAVLLTILAGIVIAIIGRLSRWDSSLAYGNAFFIAGCVVFVAGASSRLGAGQDWGAFRRLHAESFRDKSPSERADLVVKASSSVRLLVLGLLSGILLMLISLLVTKLF